MSVFPVSLLFPPETTLELSSQMGSGGRYYDNGFWVCCRGLRAYIFNQGIGDDVLVITYCKNVKR